MDAIKNKMKSLKTETENALSRAQQLETECKFLNLYEFLNSQQPLELLCIN